MPSLRPTLLLVGIIAVLVGLLWIGQGSGTFPYPRSSFMIDQSRWIYWGLALGVAGVAAIVVSRRLPRK